MKTTIRRPFPFFELIPLVVWLLVAPTLVSAAEGETADYHYIVLSLDENGYVEPVFHRRVQLAQPRVSVTENELSQEQARNFDNPDTRHESLIVRVFQDNEVVYRDVVSVIRTLRGEFHGKATESGFAIEHTRHWVGHPAVAVRVPVVEGAMLEIEGRHRSFFSLDSIEAESDALPLADFSPAATISEDDDRTKRLAATGNPANRVDLLIMGDGYTAAQSAQFNADAAAVETAFFSITPYAEYANYVNTTALFSASSQSGADHPPYNASCISGDPSCCADTTMLSDPLAGTFVNTAFDGRFCAYNIHRLLVVSNSKILAAAAAVPDWDAIFVVVNDTTYGGSGGSIAVASMHPSAPDVIRHEYGHSFTGLADEYESAYPGYPGCSDLTSPACEANVTDVTSRPLIKWGPWIDPSTPVPTPEGSGYGADVGLFEGARYLSSGMYRPRESCLMRALGVGFGEVCSQAYILKLYAGGWGVPASGIDIIEPGSESPPTGTVPTSGSVTLSVTLLEPVGGPPVNVVWTVDSVVQNGQTESSFTFHPSGSGNFLVAITVTDTTSMVHSAMAGSSLSSSRQWTVQATTTDVIFTDDFEGGTTGAWSSAVP